MDRMVHRGPDDSGLFNRGPIALGHRRLCIIDPSGGRQPMSNHEGTAWITFNGEIYNFLELRSDLTRRGHRFSTRSDTEAILVAYQEYGLECVQRLRGMFAFALWDCIQNRLVLARDRIGKKPLFYSLIGRELVFASELYALLGHPGVSRDIDLNAVDEYLSYGYIPAPRTIFRHVHKLPPAHLLTCGLDGSLELQRYWRLEYEPKLNYTENEAAEALLAELTEAVKLRLIADCPIGALLSGGIDSSVIVAIMSRISDRKVKTFSIGFDEHEFNELPYARQVANQYGTDHHEMLVRPNLLDILPTLIRHYGEPYSDSSAVPTYYVAKLTREHVTVALNGDGGDESFAGYERYLGDILANQYMSLPWSLRKLLVEPGFALLPETIHVARLRQLRRLIQSAPRSMSERYVSWMSCFAPVHKAELYTPDFKAALGCVCTDRWLLNIMNSHEARGLDRFDTLLAADIESYLPFDLLVKMDIATMANSLEARSPFLDHKFMEFSARLPAGFKIRGATLKYLLKKAAVGLVPPGNLRRRKMGFRMPMGAWMKRENGRFLKEVLLSDQAAKRGYFRPEAVSRLISHHLDGRRDHSWRLWTLLCFELWHTQFAR